MITLKLTQEEYLKIYRALELCARVRVDQPEKLEIPDFAEAAGNAKNLLATIKRRRKMPALLSEDEANAQRKRARAEARKLLKGFKAPPGLLKAAKTPIKE